jgi:tRNA pseudouridine38-40 synthase
MLLEFDGGPFVGWQRQDNGPSVQAALEDAIAAFCGVTTTVHAAGRTDAGVHALAMPAHVELPTRIDAGAMRDAVNHHLRPLPIAVLACEAAADDFHARFSAKLRRYVYRIVNRRAPLTLDSNRAWRISGALDVRAMNEGAAHLIGKHDFTTFRDSQCQSASPVKTLSALTVEREGDVVLVRTEAPSFLHHQVRSIVGTLVQVGLGRWGHQEVGAALDARDRSHCGQVAPPEGLYFAGAEY